MKARLSYNGLMELGEKLGCHQLPERSFFFKGRQLPLCARCTGVAAGQALGFAAYPIFVLSWNAMGFCCFIMFADWSLQRLNIVQSTNARRLITGILCGFALGQLYITIITKIIESIL